MAKGAIASQRRSIVAGKNDFNCCRKSFGGSSNVGPEIPPLSRRNRSFLTFWVDKMKSFSMFLQRETELYCKECVTCERTEFVAS
jgi:hypothetical protein